MKTNKLKRFEKPGQSAPSPEQIRQAQNRAVEMIMAVYDRLPANPAPVAESFEELARQAKSGVVRQSTVIQRDDFSKNNPSLPTKNDSSLPTKNIVSSAENSPENNFTETELQILEKLKNE